MNKSKLDKTHQEYKSHQELMRVRNTFSFRLGLLITESFFRKPWLVFLFPFRIIRLLFEKPENQNSLQILENKSPTILMISTTEEGLSSIGRCLEIGRKLALGGSNVIHISTSQYASVILGSETLFTLPDPKTQNSVLSAKEWNETCLNFLHQIIISRNVQSIVFDGPYPYRGVLNAFDFHPRVKKIWQRPSKLLPLDTEKEKLFDEIIIDWFKKDEQLQQTQKYYDYDSSSIDSVFLGLGCNNRNGQAKRLPSVIEQLKRIEDLEIFLPGNLNISNEIFGRKNVTKWLDIYQHLENESLNLAIIPPEPNLIKILSKRGIPSIIITSGSLPRSKVTHLRSITLKFPIIILDDPDGLEIRLAITQLLSDSIQNKLIQSD